MDDSLHNLSAKLDKRKVINLINIKLLTVCINCQQGIMKESQHNLSVRNHERKSAQFVSCHLDIKQHTLSAYTRKILLMVVKTLSVLLHLDIKQHTLSAYTSKKPVNRGQNTVCAASSGHKTTHTQCLYQQKAC